MRGWGPHQGGCGKDNAMTRRGLRDVDRKPPLDLATGRMKCVCV